MTAREFYDLTKAVREAQRTYFRTRLPSDLEKSKRLEKQLDNEIKRVEQVIKERQNPQMKLNFDI